MDLLTYSESTVHEDGRRELKVFKDGVLGKHEFDLTKEESEALKAGKGWFQRVIEMGANLESLRNIPLQVHGAVENKGE